MFASNMVLADGTTQIFPVPFPYISKSHVHVYVDGAEVASNTLVFSSPNIVAIPSGLGSLAGRVVQVKRITPSNQNLVSFTFGGLDDSDLNLGFVQLLYVIQELLDQLAVITLQSPNQSFTYPNGVYMAQVLQGLADPSNVGYDPTFLVLGNIPPDVPYSPVNTGFKAPGMRTRDNVYQFIQAQLGLSAAQMDTFMLQCSAYPLSPESLVPAAGSVLPASVSPTMVQVLQGLSKADPAGSVLQNLPPLLPYNPVSAAFFSNCPVRLGDAFATFVQATLGYTSIQMGAFLSACISYPVSP